MKTIEVTDEQYAYIQHLREEISESVVGKYGFVRERDAVQFLIDNADEDLEIDGEFDSSATDDVTASVDAAIEGGPDPHELEEISYDESTDPDGEGSPADDEPATDEQSEPEDDERDPEGGDEDDVSEDSGETDEGSSASDDADDGSSGGGDADDDDMLNEMMSLLETHDDKWEESSSADYRYTVALPDGSSEDVQTKDDVRALLFKNYR
ncbi:hypothetical protein [Natrialba swarupiae]|uniref:Uncharacterized protein n=1 Tax=Natrialba swarupiae TaxID=2448032 RepID=A0A5D5AL30_9EURY|nr:hypothetical protein [Natrialba swarupiae]MCW8172835.1 hypothetical protein [Natrialba swarupiae]TYT61874.1 hypothetical protein FYC77_11600 [Natrialba swarupiae]